MARPGARSVPLPRLRHPSPGTACWGGDLRLPPRTGGCTHFPGKFISAAEPPKGSGPSLFFPPSHAVFSSHLTPTPPSPAGRLGQTPRAQHFGRQLEASESHLLRVASDPGHRWSPSLRRRPQPALQMHRLRWGLTPCFLPGRGTFCWKAVASSHCLSAALEAFPLTGRGSGPERLSPWPVSGTACHLGDPVLTVKQTVGASWQGKRTFNYPP